METKIFELKYKSQLFKNKKGFKKNDFLNNINTVGFYLNQGEIFIYLEEKKLINFLIKYFFKYHFKSKSFEIKFNKNEATFFDSEINIKMIIFIYNYLFDKKIELETLLYSEKLKDNEEISVLTNKESINKDKTYPPDYIFMSPFILNTKNIFIIRDIIDEMKIDFKMFKKLKKIRFKENIEEKREITI